LWGSLIRHQEVSKLHIIAMYNLNQIIYQTYFVLKNLKK